MSRFIAHHEHAHHNTLPRVLSIAGSDTGGGAGIQADIKTLGACGAYALTAITALTAQSDQGVQAVWPVMPEQLLLQIECALSFQPAAIKLGMLGTGALAQVVADCLTAYPHIPVIADTVICASSGAALLDEEGIDILRDVLLPRACIVTPNRHEARLLFGSDDDKTLHSWVLKHRVPILLTGGDSVLHAVGDPQFCTDTLITTEYIEHLTALYVETPNQHGTGCTLSAALAGFIAHGFSLPEAVNYARQFVQQALQAGATQHWPDNGPLHHFFAFGTNDPSETAP
ncbi:MAG: bifunctional hydroxymethylpyrimidine kinase/phosphomethylpyrimidine kinase [Pseudomonadales bacterium]